MTIFFASNKKQFKHKKIKVTKGEDEEIVKLSTFGDKVLDLRKNLEIEILIVLIEILHLITIA